MKQQKGETPPEGGEVAGDKYISPVFSFDEEEHRELISAAGNVDLVLKGERGHDVRVSASHRSSTQHSTDCCTLQCVFSEQQPPLRQSCMLQVCMLLWGSMCFAHVCSPAANARGHPPTAHALVPSLMQALMPALPEQLDEDDVDEGAGGGKRMSLPTFRRRKPAAAERTPEDETLREVSCLFVQKTLCAAGQGTCA